VAQPTTVFQRRGMDLHRERRRRLGDRRDGENLAGLD
jgi:hypothetical protein